MIGYIKRNGDAKIPDNADKLLSQIATNMREIFDPYLTNYLVKKGKIVEEVAAYVNRREVENRYDAALSLMACHAGVSTENDEVGVESTVV